MAHLLLTQSMSKAGRLLENQSGNCVLRGEHRTAVISYNAHARVSLKFEVTRSSSIPPGRKSEGVRLRRTFGHSLYRDNSHCTLTRNCCNALHHVVIPMCWPSQKNSIFREFSPAHTAVKPTHARWRSLTILLFSCSTLSPGAFLP